MMSDFTDVMKSEKRVEGRGRDNVSGTDNKQRKLQAGAYNGLLSGENERQIYEERGMSAGKYRDSVIEC